MAKKYSPLLYTQKKGYRFKNSDDGKKILPEIRQKKKLSKPRQEMRKFIDEKGFVHLCSFRPGRPS